MLSRFFLGLGLLGIISISPAFADQVSIAKQQCQKLLKQKRHLSADYVPDRGSRGEALVPVDVEGQARIRLPDEIKFDLALDLVEKYKPAAASKGLQGKAVLGQMSIKGKSVYWNGQKLSGPEKDEITEECAKTYQN